MFAWTACATEPMEEVDDTCIDGKCDEIPEQAFYLKGGIEEVYEAAEKLAKA